MTPPDDSLPLPARLMMLAGVAGGAGGALDGVLEKLPTSVLAAALTDLVLFANRAGGSITNACTARDIQWRSLLGAPT